MTQYYQSTYSILWFFPFLYRSQFLICGYNIFFYVARQRDFNVHFLLALFPLEFLFVCLFVFSYSLCIFLKLRSLHYLLEECNWHKAIYQCQGRKEGSGYLKHADFTLTSLSLLFTIVPPSPCLLFQSLVPLVLFSKKIIFRLLWRGCGGGWKK